MQVQVQRKKVKKPRRKSTPRFLEQLEGRQDLNRIEPRTVNLPQGKERESGDWKRGRNRGDAESEKGIALEISSIKRKKAKARQNEYSNFCAREDNNLCRLLAPALHPRNWLQEEYANSALPSLARDYSLKTLNCGDPMPLEDVETLAGFQYPTTACIVRSLWGTPECSARSSGVK